MSILRSDKRVVIHGYTAKHDQNLNEMLDVLNDINNIIDLIIIAQAKEVGILLTEDRVIHKHRNEIGIDVLNWRSFVKRFNDL